MYIAYNAWYRQVTGTLNDRQSISSLKKRYVIWDDYLQGKTMRTLKPYMDRLVELTQREPFMSKNAYWTGSIESPDDWRSLIEYWYQVRCRVVHGSGLSPKYVWLAYETLDAFMTEIVDRMHQCSKFKYLVPNNVPESIADDNARRTDRFKKVQQKLYQKYIALPDVWQVDMQRADIVT